MQPPATVLPLVYHTRPEKNSLIHSSIPCILTSELFSFISFYFCLSLCYFLFSSFFLTLYFLSDQTSFLLVPPTHPSHQTTTYHKTQSKSTTFTSLSSSSHPTAPGTTYCIKVAQRTLLASLLLTPATFVQRFAFFLIARSASLTLLSVWFIATTRTTHYTATWTPNNQTA